MDSVKEWSLFQEAGIRHTHEEQSSGACDVKSEEHLPNLAVDVLLQLEHQELANRPFTYAVPAEWREQIQVGVPVSVSFGGMPRVFGYVVGINPNPSDTIRLKPIREVLDSQPVFDAAYFSLLEWVAEYYATPIHDVVNCALPSNLIQKTKKEIALSPDESISPLKLLTLPLHAQQLVRFLQETPGKYYAVSYLPKVLNLNISQINTALAALKKECWLLQRQTTQDSTQAKTEPVVFVQPEFSNEANLTSKQREIYQTLCSVGSITKKHLLELHPTANSHLKKLEEKNAVRVKQQEIHRDPLAYFDHMAANKPVILSEAQQSVVDTVMSGSAEKPYLLYGVTGSGKTEVYLTLTQKILAAGRSVLVMVPEIALTSQLARRFIEFFGKNNIALWHSHLSAGEKADTWRRLARGELRIVIAARSGIWAPLQYAGLVILDEEHDTSFKQDSPAPRYHAGTVARELCRRTGAKLLLGSATPDVCSHYQAQQNNTLLIMSQRFGGRPMANVTIADMKQERMSGVRGHLSRLLVDELKTNLSQQEQSIILINRRGFYTTLQCMNCDLVFTCFNCSVSLTYHKPLNQVRCHYCGHVEKVPQFCPQCASMKIQQSGVGTQRVEEELQKALPDARILRMDTDTLRHKNSHHEIYHQFAQGEADILLGTQMVAKGLDIANVTLVGVIAADSSFTLPDFKSTERGFQLLTQVAGRAGRGSKPGRVIFQATYHDHPVLLHASRQDYDAFYTEELQTRQEFQFPPFSQLFRMIVSSEDEKTGLQFIQAAHAHLRVRLLEEGLYEQILLVGPASCVIPRIQGRFRYHLMIKNMAGPTGHTLITDFYRNTRAPEGVHYLLDVDALSFL